MHFLVKIGARDGSLCRHSRIIIIKESNASVRIVWLDLVSRPSAERAGAVQKNIVFWRFWHRPACECTSTLLSHFKRWRKPDPKFYPKLFAGYRSRPGGSAEGGMWGVDEGVPEFAETLLGAGCGSPIPSFISRCSLAQRGQNALPVSSSRRLASS